MAMPLALLARAKDLLLYGPSDGSVDALILGKWTEIQDKVCREYDLFFKPVSIPLVTGKSIYSVPADSTRIFSLAYKGNVLGYLDRENLDFLNPDWETALPNIPRYWTYNAVPGEVDTPIPTITPREFLIYPAPDGAAANGESLLLLYEYRTGDVPKWLEPVILYLTVGRVAEENPNLIEPEKGQWFKQLGEYWLDNARKRFQV